MSRYIQLNADIDSVPMKAICSIKQT